MQGLFKEIEEYLKSTSKSKDQNGGKLVRLGTSDRYTVFVVGKCIVVQDKHLQVDVCMPLLDEAAIDIGE